MLIFVQERQNHYFTVVPGVVFGKVLSTLESFAESNPDHQIAVTNTGFIVKYNSEKKDFEYCFTGTFGTIVNVGYGPFHSDFMAHWEAINKA
jgi:hypothetical protein